ncbi:MAG TPA: M20 family metallopeptidase [Candidatus Dormibacteraeota bacterium]
MRLIDPSPSVLDEVVEVRRHLHRQPEVSWEEHATSEFIRGRLAELGLRVDECPTPTGAVAFLDTGKPGRTVLCRADIDALPILEESGVAYESTREGRMHACGHDAHAAIMLGVARTLAENADRLSGSFLFVFQPAEEIVSGAKKMIAEGLLDRYQLDACLGLHTWAPADSGFVLVRPGLQWAGVDFFELDLLGPGGHGGVIKRAGNVIAAQAFILERLFSVVEGLELDGVPCHTTVGDVRTDGAWNIVPRRVHVRGSLRTFSPDLRQQALQRLDDLALEAGTEFEVEAAVRIVMGSSPLKNDPDVTSTVIETGRELIGDRMQHLGRPLTVGDDIAEFLTRIPGCYFMLGCRPPDAETPPAHHSPTFRLDEPAFATGVRVLAESAARLARAAP